MFILRNSPLLNFLQGDHLLMTVKSGDLETAADLMGARTCVVSELGVHAPKRDAENGCVAKGA